MAVLHTHTVNVSIKLLRPPFDVVNRGSLGSESGCWYVCPCSYSFRVPFAFRCLCSPLTDLYPKLSLFAEGGISGESPCPTFSAQLPLCMPYRTTRPFGSWWILRACTFHGMPDLFYW